MTNHKQPFVIGIPIHVSAAECNLQEVYEHEVSQFFFFLIKPADAPISQIYFCQETLHVSGSSSFHHQEFFTVHLALVYVMQVLMTYTSAECTVENS